MCLYCLRCGMCPPGLKRSEHSDAAAKAMTSYELYPRGVRELVKSAGEARNSLEHAVFAHSQGRIRDRSEAAKQKCAMAINLVIAAITFWNSIYMDKAANHISKTSPLYDPALLPFTSPLGWDHIILSGDFDWHSRAVERKIARPRHIRSPRNWGAGRVRNMFSLRVILRTNLPMGPIYPER